MSHTGSPESSPSSSLECPVRRSSTGQTPARSLSAGLQEVTSSTTHTALDALAGPHPHYTKFVQSMISIFFTGVSPLVTNALSSSHSLHISNKKCKKPDGLLTRLLSCQTLAPASMYTQLLMQGVQMPGGQGAHTVHTLCARYYCYQLRQDWLCQFGCDVSCLIVCSWRQAQPSLCYSNTEMAPIGMNWHAVITHFSAVHNEQKRCSIPAIAKKAKEEQEEDDQGTEHESEQSTRSPSPPVLYVPKQSSSKKVLVDACVT